MSDTTQTQERKLTMRTLILTLILTGGALCGLYTWREANSTLERAILIECLRFAGETGDHGRHFKCREWKRAMHSLGLESVTPAEVVRRWEDSRIPRPRRDDRHDSTSVAAEPEYCL